jgi:hypothetical protein
MVHNNKVLSRGWSHSTEGWGTACGIEKDFHTDRQRDIWIRIHRKTCLTCSTSRYVALAGNERIQHKPK